MRTPPRRRNSSLNPPIAVGVSIEHDQDIEQGLGARPDLGGVADGRARRARRDHRAEHDPRATCGASIEQLEWTVNAYNLSFAVLLMTAAALGDRFGRRRLFAAGLGAVRARVGRLRAGAGRRRADRGARRAGRRRGAGDAAGAGAASARRSRPSAAARRSASSSASPASPWRAARWSAARSPRASPGSGSSGSTCRSGCRDAAAVLTRLDGELRPATPALDVGGLALATGGALGLVWGLVRGNTAGWGSAEVVGGAAPPARC